MFDNIASLKLVKGTNNETNALSMISSEGEVMEFRQPVSTDGRVEDWMTTVEAEMKNANRLITKEAVFFYRDNTSRFVMSLHFCFNKYS